jgi:hypothetical protein
MGTISTEYCRAYLVDFLRLNLEQSKDLITVIVLDWCRPECIRKHFISGEAALVDDHGGKDESKQAKTIVAF